MKIMVVEDDKVIASLVSKNLNMWGYDTCVAEDFERIMQTFIEFNPQLVLLDITLPFFNGYHWCQEIRKVSKVPIIFLSSASDNMNIVMAMNMGADDFVAKPFDISVLLAKIQAILRRSYEFTVNNNIIECNGVVLDIASTMIYYNKEKIELTKNEFKILQVLMENRGNVVQREYIIEKLWESDSYIDDNTLTVNVTRLRKKLGQSGINDYIMTKKGMGYYIE